MASDRKARDPRQRRADVIQTARDLVVAALAVILIIGGIWAYAGVWPPMVVVESGSMMHQEDVSSIGVIDTGDLTLVKAVDKDADVRTYMEARDTGYETYGNYGDVIIYAKNCDFSQTPIIHRAITRIVLNASGDAFDFPELDPPIYNVANAEVSLGEIRTFHVNRPLGDFVEFQVNVGSIAANMLAGDGTLHGGFLTKGDNNSNIDQVSLTAGFGHGLVQPVEHRCVLGVARGELPWFGAIKLWLGSAGHAVPGNSATSLIIALIAIVTVPYALERVWGRYGERVKSRFPETWRRKWHAFFDKLPGGKRRAKERAENDSERGADAARRERRKKGRRKNR